MPRVTKTHKIIRGSGVGKRGEERRKGRGGGKIMQGTETVPVIQAVVYKKSLKALRRP